jgi:hypothetical protein
VKAPFGSRLLRAAPQFLELYRGELSASARFRVRDVPAQALLGRGARGHAMVLVPGGIDHGVLLR